LGPLKASELASALANDKLVTKPLAKANLGRRGWLTAVRQSLVPCNYSIKNFILDRSGAAAIEYVLIITLITIGIVGALAFFAEDLIAFISNVPI
jgi:Flp pilus assembly pilin Flp